MPTKFSEEQLLKSLNALEDSLSKSQIVNDHIKRVGRNSERRDWAGSMWEDESTPDNTKDGTNYNPPKKLAKNIHEMSTEEIENVLQMRKSEVPNAVAARNEIMSVIKGVEEATCPTCNGAGMDMNKSMCSSCGGHGYFLIAPNESAEIAMKSIADKYNVNREAYAELAKGGSGHKGGGSDSADTTPSGLESMEPEEMDHTGEAAFKGDYDEEDMEEMGGEEEFGGGAEGMAMGKALPKVLRAIVKSQKAMLERQNDLYRRQGHLFNVVNASAQHQVNMTKSLTGIESTPQAARAPKALGPGLQILNKGFVDQAPGRGLTGGGNPAQNGGQYQSKYDWKTLKKGASDMVLCNKLNHMDVLRMDSGVEVPAALVQKVEAFIDSNGVHQQQ